MALEPEETVSFAQAKRVRLETSKRTMERMANTGAGVVPCRRVVFCLEKS